MACIGCEEYAKRVTNVFRDEEIKEKFLNLTGYEIQCDCFICDKCNAKLLQAQEFKENCIKIYKKNNPNSIPLKNHTIHSSAIEGNKEYYIIETNEEDVLINEEDDDTISQNQFVHIDPTTSNQEDGHHEYSIFELEETPSTIPKVEQKKSLNKLEKPRTNLKRKQSNLNINDNLESGSEEKIEEEEEEENLNDSVKTNVKGRKSYSLQQKLEIIEYSEKNSNREASRHYNLNESTVRCFRRQKESLLKMSPNATKSTNRRGTPYWPNLELKLKEWTEQQKKKPKINEIKSQAIKIAKELNYDTFQGTASWTFKFMQRHNIGSSQPRPRKQTPKPVKNDD